MAATQGEYSADIAAWEFSDISALLNNRERNPFRGFLNQEFMGMSGDAQVDFSAEHLNDSLQIGL